MPPPHAEQLATRIILGPALRTQPDRRLVRLVREGYDGAFEEIVRRYRRQLDRFAAAIVGGRSEDVTQDALSKAVLALRGSEAEIELRPWLYRIVRNTALNDLRDRPPAASELSETLASSPSAAVEAERREEIGELMARLRALPEPQRAAIVMRELEGLSHEEIAAALGVSGGAARQAIHRARAALRDGFGILVPLPLLRTLIDHSAEAAGGAAVAAAGAGGGAAGALGGLGAGGVLKLGVATALIAGSIGAGVAIQHDHGAGSGRAEAASAGLPVDQGPGNALGPAEANGQGVRDAGRGSGRDGGSDDGKGEEGGAGGRGPDRVRAADPRSGHGSGPGPSPDASGPSQSGPGRDGSGEDGSGGGSPGGGDERSGDGGSAGRLSGGRGDSGGGESSGSDGHSGELSGGDRSGAGATTTGGGSGSGEELEAETVQDGGSGSGGSDGGSDGSGSSGGSDGSRRADGEISP